MTSQIDPDVIEIAKSLADTASKIGHKYFRLNPQIEKKIDGSPVTIADLEIERALRQIIRERYPDHGFYGEEEGHDNSDAEWLWVVDPIDGTKSFATGKRTYGCLIALCFQDKPVLGIIDMPALNERWLGVQGNPTEYNGTVCHTSLNKNLDILKKGIVSGRVLYENNTFYSLSIEKDKKIGTLTTLEFGTDKDGEATSKRSTTTFVIVD